MWNALLATALIGQSRDVADVTFENLTKHPAYVFVRQTRQTIGPIAPRESRLVRHAFGVGDNQFLVFRDSSPDARSALARDFSKVVYRAATGQPPSPVSIDIREEQFAMPTPDPKSREVTIRNDTKSDLLVAFPAVKEPFVVSPGKTSKVTVKLHTGDNRVIAVARRLDSDARQRESPILDFATVSVVLTVGGIQRHSGITISDASFRDGGLVSGPSLEGTWRMPDGLVVRFQGKNGYWVEVGHLASFGFKPGDHGFRGFVNSREQPNVFKGEVLYRTSSGETEDWRPQAITVKDGQTLNTSAGDWKRVRG